MGLFQHGVRSTIGRQVDYLGTQLIPERSHCWTACPGAEALMCEGGPSQTGFLPKLTSDPP